MVARYVELDFPEITTKKAMAIKKHKELSAPLEDLRLGMQIFFEAIYISAEALKAGAGHVFILASTNSLPETCETPLNLSLN